MSNVPDPRSQARCLRPGCGHPQADHDAISTGACLVRDCACTLYLYREPFGTRLGRLIRH